MSALIRHRTLDLMTSSHTYMHMHMSNVHAHVIQVRMHIDLTLQQLNALQLLSLNLGMCFLLES